jgi:hypothetical protein
MSKNILLNLKKSLNFLDNKTYRYLVIVLLVLYSSFVSIRYNYSNLFNHWLVRLLFLIVIVYVSMKDVTIGILLAISMLISINYKPVLLGEHMQNATEEEEGMQNEDEDVEEGMDNQTTSKTSDPVPSNVEEKNKKNNGPEPSAKKVETSQPADLTKKPVASNNSVNTPVSGETPESDMVDVPSPPQNNEGFLNFGRNEYFSLSDITSGINSALTQRQSRERYENKAEELKKQLEQRKAIEAARHRQQNQQEHFSANGYTNDYDEDTLAPVSFTKSGNCLDVLRNTNGSSLNLSSPCGAVATFKDEINAQGFVKLPMGKGKCKMFTPF